MLGFDDPDKRRRSVELLIQSIDYAHRYGAKAVVVHPGEVPFAYNIDEELKRLYRETARTPSLTGLCGRKCWSSAKKASPIYTKRIVESLDQVSEYIARKGYSIAIGIETRSRCYQMPSLQEAKNICERLMGSPVYLWYDIGHAMMMDRMGLYDNLKELQDVEKYIYGVHIHETLELSDHWCPYVHSKEHYFDHFLR